MTTINKKMPSNKNLTKNDLYKLIDLYYKQPNILYSHQHNSFNQFVDEYIYSILKKDDNIFFSKITQNYVYNYKFKFDDIYLKPATLENAGELMFPSDARVSSLTYSSKLVATITQIQERIDVVTKEKTEKIIGDKEQEYHITNIPIMLRSKYCSLNIKKNHDKTECNYDPGGYFIINGSEKVVISLERMIENKPLVFIKKDQSNKIYTVQVNSKDYDTEITQIFSIRLKKDNTLTMKIPQFNEIPIFILVKAMGLESDKDITNYVVNDSNDVDMINLVRSSLDNTLTENKEKILTQEDAVNYLISKMKSTKKYSDVNAEDRIAEKRMHLMYVLRKDILPHMKTNVTKKAYYICNMIHKLLKCYLGRTDIDDRDSYVNKRVDVPGVLISMLFKQYFKKMLNECNKFFKKRNPDDENPINIIGQIKPNIIEQGLKSSLLTGSWGGSKNKKGVAQVLARLSFLQAISYLRRVSSPTVDASTNKLTNPRHLHNTQYGMVCVTGDTQVLMSDGTIKLIKNMKNGDCVMTVNLTNLEYEPSKIKNYFNFIPDELYKIRTRSGREIKCTGDHPFLVRKNENFIWKKAELLTMEDLLIVEDFGKEYDLLKKEGINVDICEYKTNARLKNGRGLIEIESICIIKNNKERVYDFETVSENHNFIANGLLTHNCPVETPEGAKVGLVKSLAVMSNITLMLESQTYIIKKVFENKLLDLEDVHPFDFNKYVKVYLNGEWLGMTKEPNELANELRRMRRDNELEKTVSVVFDTKLKEIRVYCDGGRLYRPLLKVKDNKLFLTKDIINNIELKSNNKAKLTKWTDLMQKYPDVIEYVDVEESNGLMIAMYTRDVDKMRNLMNAQPSENPEETKINRYDNSVFVRYTHCEIHPSLMLGVVASSIPYCNHNQSPRNIYQYSQARQAMGIYNSSYRYRLDISYVLHHPQTPLVTTRSSEYLHTDSMAAGENAIVAICSYSGYNQEDSVIFNQSAIDRGLFRAVSFKKYQETIDKNPSTSQDDIFTKPDRNKVIGTKSGSYDKLNDKGYVPEETKVVNGDIIIGKISPIQPTGNNNKVYKDSSIAYKSNVPGVIDKVWTDIYTHEGYQMYKMRVRSVRIPKIGDKMCLTEDHDVLTMNGWKGIKDLNINDEIAVLRDNILEYEKPTKLYKYKNSDDLYEIKTSQVDLLTTTNHRMWVKTTINGKYRGIEAREITGKKVWYKKNAINVKEDIEYFEIDEYEYFCGTNNNQKMVQPKMKLEMDSWLIFLGLYLAEGCCDHRLGRVRIYVHKDRVRNALDEVCKKMNIVYSDDKSATRFVFVNKRLYTYLKDFGKADVKYLPDFVWTLSQRQCNILLDSLICGDGYERSDMKEYYTSSIRLANDVQRLTLHAGLSGNISIKKEKGEKLKIKGVETIRKNNQYRIGIIRNNLNRPSVNPKNKTTQEIVKFYDNYVYCCELPSHVFYVRRNGKAVWTHNSSRHGQLGHC